MTEIGEKIVDGLALVLVIIIALLIGIGIGTILVWRGPMPVGAVTGSVLIVGSILGVTTLVCYCLRAWVKSSST